MLNLESRFAVRDVRSIPDPFGAGLTFHIAREGVRGWVERSQERLARNPVYQEMYRGLAESQVTDKKARDRVMARRLDKVSLVEALRQGGVDREGIAEHLIKNIDGLEDENGPVTYTPSVGVELLSSTVPIPDEVYDPPRADEIAAAEKETERLMREAEDGEDVDPIVAEGLTIPAGTGLGDALAAWVQRVAANSEAYRDSFIGGVAKNSEAPSASG